MKPLSVLFLILPAFLVCAAGSAHADFDLEVGLNNGYTNNLLSEISSRDDSYSTARLLARYYPSQQLQLNLGADYTYYNRLIGLSSLAPQAGLIWIPTTPDNAEQLYVETRLTSRRYRTAYSTFDTNEGLFKATLALNVSRPLSIRYGCKINFTNYITPDSLTDGDSEQYELFAGANLTLPGNNALDLETGFGLTNFAFIDAFQHPTLARGLPFPPWAQYPPTEFIDPGDFRAAYISPRWSRPLGTNTGISITYVYRQFLDIGNAVVLGLTTDFLSPWASFFDGSSIRLRLKTFVIPHCILTGGVGYWDKTYLRSTEVDTVITPAPRPDDPDRVRIDILWTDPEDATARRDDMTHAYLTIQRPLVLGSGAVIEPSLSLEYIDNRSTHNNYDYSTTAVSFSLMIRP